MNDTTIKLMRERAKIVTDQRGMLDRADGEKRSLTSEENEAYEKMDTRFDEIEKTLERERINEERSMATEKGADAFKPVPEDRSLAPRTLEYRGTKIFLPHNHHDVQQRMFYSSDEGSSDKLSNQPKERHSLSASKDSEGGYTIPVDVALNVVHGLDNETFIHRLATVFPLTETASLGVPTLSADMSDADWTAEAAQIPEDTAMSFGRRQLAPKQLAKRVKVSERLLRTSAIDMESFVIDRLIHSFARACENAFLNGDGNNRPLGLFALNANGISAGRDVTEDNKGTLTADGVMNAFYKLKGQYQAKSSWIFHRNVLKVIRKLKDAQGNYLWSFEKNLVDGQPDTLLGRPCYMSEYCPDTIGGDKYAGIVGDFSYYWIADSLAMKIQRLGELYAETSQIGFIGRLETDGMPVLEEAFARIKISL